MMNESAVADTFRELARQASELSEENKQLCKRLDAALKDMRMLVKNADNGCDVCAHHHVCAGKQCPKYIGGVGVKWSDGSDIPNMRWSCMDFEFGTCPMLQDTPCADCDFENNWKWRDAPAEGDKHEQKNHS